MLKEAKILTHKLALVLLMKIIKLFQLDIMACHVKLMKANSVGIKAKV